MAKPPVVRKGARSLEDIMRASMPTPAAPTEAAAAPTADVKAPAPALAGNGAQAPRKLPYVNTIVTEDDHDRLKMLAVRRRTSIQKLGIEAWNLLLRQEGLPELDAQAANRPSGRKGV